MANNKISQLTAKSANLATTDLLEVSEVSGLSYVSKKITGKEIIDGLLDNVTLDLQSVTDNGNITTTPIYVGDLSASFSEIGGGSIQTVNLDNGTYAYIGQTGILGLHNGDVESQLKNTDVSAENNVILEFPDKTSGSYTIATISDVTALDLQAVTDAGNTTTNDIIVNDGTEETTVSGASVKSEDTIANTFAQLNSFGSLALKNGNEISQLKNTNVTNVNVLLEFPNKTAGSYTIATTSDLTSGTVTSVGLTTGTSGTDINVTSSPITSSGDITLNIPIAGASSTGKLSSTDWSTFNNKGNGSVTSVDLTMPSAFTVTGNPITSSGTLAVAGAGVVSQYVRGDGSLANFPSVSGGGASQSFYLNGSVSQGTFGGVAFKEMDRVPILGTGTNFSINSDGYIQSFITDANVPNQLAIPAGNWNFEMYFSASSGGGSPRFYIELYKLSAGTLTLIASSSANPEFITNGTAVDLYTTAVAVPSTVLLAADRLAIRVYVIHSSKTITLHTEDSNLCQVITTFSTGLTALNGLTDQVQNFATGTSGTDFGINSTGSTHTFNLPTASATNRGALSTTDWSAFNAKASYTPRVQSVTSASTVTPVNTNDLVKITAQAAALALANPTGTWDEGQPLMIRIKDNGTARAITYDTNYRAIGVTLPTTTVISKTTYLGLIYNATDTKWDVIGVTTQA